MQDFLNSSDIDVLIDRFQRKNSYENLNIIFEKDLQFNLVKCLCFYRNLF